MNKVLSVIAIWALVLAPLPVRVHAQSAGLPGYISGTVGNCVKIGTGNVPADNGSACGSGGGSSFSPYPSGAAGAQPLTANFTAVNSLAGVTFNDKTQRLVISQPNASAVTPRYYVSNTALPSTPYTVSMCGMMAGNNVSTNGIMLGVAVLDNSNNAVTGAIYVTPNSTSAAPTTAFFRGQWNSSFAMVTSSSVAVNTFGAALFGVRITDDGTNRVFYYSYNCQDWWQYNGTEPTNTGVTPTKAGIFYYYFGAASPYPNAMFSIYYWNVANSILPAIGS